MLEDALTYPTKGESGIARLLIGGGLVLLGFLLLPAFIVGGYMVRALDSTSRGAEEPPAFEDWTGLLVDGLKAALVGLAYAIVPMVLLLVVMLVLGAGLAAGGNSGGVLASLGLLGLLVTALVLLAIQYMVPAALTNFAREGSMGAAFDLDTLTPVWTSKSYVVATLLVFAVAIVGAVAFGILVTLTFGLGAVLYPFFYFWLYLAGVYLYGNAFAAAITHHEGDTAPGAAAAN